jgi:hypothetical protein
MEGNLEGNITHIELSKGVILFEEKLHDIFEDTIKNDVKIKETRFKRRKSHQLMTEQDENYRFHTRKKLSSTTDDLKNKTTTNNNTYLSPVANSNS